MHNDIITPTSTLIMSLSIEGWSDQNCLNLNRTRPQSAEYFFNLIVLKFGVLLEQRLVNTNVKPDFKKYSVDRGRVLFKIFRVGQFSVINTSTHYEHVCRWDSVLVHRLITFKFVVLVEHMLVNTNAKPDLRNTQQIEAASCLKM